jgi:hypothetical protein
MEQLYRCDSVSRASLVWTGFITRRSGWQWATEADIRFITYNPICFLKPSSAFYVVELYNEPFENIVYKIPEASVRELVV